MTRLVLVRHGQSVWNQQHRIQGHSGDGLTESGLQQSLLTAQWVATTHPDACLVSSDLQRCRETAVPIADAIGADVIEDPQVRERSFGRWEGMSMDEVAAADPELWQRWRTGEDVVDEVGGETGSELAARVVAALRGHVEALGGEGRTLVVVTHGGPVWHGMHALLDLAWGTLGGVGNAAVTEIVEGELGWWCDSWNQTAHLPRELRTSFRPSETRSAASRG